MRSWWCISSPLPALVVTNSNGASQILDGSAEKCAKAGVVCAITLPDGPGYSSELLKAVTVKCKGDTDKGERELAERLGIRNAGCRRNFHHAWKFCWRTRRHAVEPTNVDSQYRWFLASRNYVVIYVRGIYYARYKSPNSVSGLEEELYTRGLGKWVNETHNETRLSTLQQLSNRKHTSPSVREMNNHSHGYKSSAPGH